MAGFSIYPRKLKKKTVYYVQFKQPDGTYSTARSTGQTTKKAARQWAEEYLIKNGVYLPGREITFEQYSKDFFSWSGTWALDKRSRGLRISESQCIFNNRQLEKQVMPFFKDYRLSEINRGMIKEFRNKMFQKGYAGSTINKALSLVRQILESAVDDELIQSVPRIDTAALNQLKKGILTIDETNRIFNHTWTTVESWCHPAKINYIGKTANRLSASTGMRAGEIQGLVHSDIDLDRGLITVRRSYNNTLKKWNESTKNKTTRTIFIPEIVKNELEFLIKSHPEPGPDKPVFFSEKYPDQPCVQDRFRKSLKKALSEIGISEQEQKERNIHFHSWRGFMNSLLINAKIPLQKVMSITGHLSPEMATHYYTVDDMQDVRELQENLFSGTPTDHTGEGVH